MVGVLVCFGLLGYNCEFSGCVCGVVSVLQYLGLGILVGWLRLLDGGGLSFLSFGVVWFMRAI